MPFTQTLMNGFLILMLLRLIVPSTFHAAITSPGMTGLDSGQYYDAAVRLNEHAALYPYDVLGFPNPPLIAICLRPVVRLSSFTAYVRVWIMLNIACAVAALACILYTVKRPGTTLTCLGMILLFRNWPMVLELSIGNVHPMILLCYCVAFAGISRNRWLPAILAIAVAGNLKSWAGAPIIGFLLCRKYREFILCGLIATLLLITQFVIVGFSNVRPFIDRQIGYAAQPGLVCNSVPGLARMLFRTNPLSTPWVHSNVLYWTTILFTATALILILRVAIRLHHPASATSNLLLFLTIIPVMLVLHPLAHLTVYTILLAPLLIVIFIAFLDSKKFSIVPVLMCLAVYLVASTTYPGINPLPKWAHSGIGILIIGGWPVMAFTVLIALILMMSAERNSILNNSVPHHSNTRKSGTTTIEPVPVSG